jgi:hypothetical protein
MSKARRTDSDLRAALQGINDIHERLFGLESELLTDEDVIDALYELIDRGIAVANGSLDDPDTIIELRTWTVH